MKTFRFQKGDRLYINCVNGWNGNNSQAIELNIYKSAGGISLGLAFLT